jgi:hypothetical protein
MQMRMHADICHLLFLTLAVAFFVFHFFPLASYLFVAFLLPSLISSSPLSPVHTSLFASLFRSRQREDDINCEEKRRGRDSRDRTDSGCLSFLLLSVALLRHLSYSSRSPPFSLTNSVPSLLSFLFSPFFKFSSYFSSFSSPLPFSSILLAVQCLTAAVLCICASPCSFSVLQSRSLPLPQLLLRLF